MARCFPYPPPEGYLGIGGVGGGRALLGGPVKPHAETEKHAKKVTEKWLKRKSSGSNKVEESISKRIKVTTKNGVGSQNKGSKEEEDESSGVTEEHGLPVTSQSPCHSSESVRVSNQWPVAAEVSLERKRNVFRIKLHVPKPEKPANSELLDQTSTSCSQQKNDVVSERNSAVLPSTSELWKDEKDVSAKVAKTLIDVSSGSKKTSRSKKTSIQDLYDSLTNGWTTPALEVEQSEQEEELDWLFASKKPGSSSSGGEAQSKNVSSCSAAIGLRTRAQFLPEVEVYALPYTVPF